MNLSNCLFRIKTKLGLLNITTPFDDLNGTIIEILREMTIPTFSVYSPAKQSMSFQMKDLEIIESTGEYIKLLLPDFKTRKLLYVIDVNTDYSHLSGYSYYSGELPLLYGGSYQQLILAGAGTNMMSQVIPKMTFKFERERTLYLYNAVSSATLSMELGFEHDENLISITDDVRDEFLKLALLDVKENLYPTMKQYSEMNTAIGNINLKIDDWANAEQERLALLEKWDDVYHFDMQPFYWR